MSRSPLLSRLLFAVALAVVAVCSAVAGSFAIDRMLPPAAAQDFGEKPVAVRAMRCDPVEAPRGGGTSFVLELTIAEGWHLYPQGSPSGPVKFSWDDLPAWLVPGAVEDVSIPVEKESFGALEKLFEHELIVRQRFTVAADAPLGEYTLDGDAGWQRCDANSCSFDKHVPMKAVLRVVEASATTAGSGATTGSGATSSGAAADGGGAAVGKAAGPGGDFGAGDGGAGDGGPERFQLNLKLILTALAMGGLTILTPCVFPLLPVTVSFFSKQKGPALPRSLVYAAGIIFTITVIGLLLGQTLDLVARGWVFNLAVGILFFVLSLSLFGLFDLRVPSFLTDYSTNRAGAGGYVGAFFMAMTLALTSFSCSVPFLSIMFEQFNSGGRLVALTGLLVYSVTLAAPFFLCSLFPTAIRALPKSGDWMNAVKVVMGFVEFALAFKFFRTVALNFQSDVLPRGFVLAIWAACALGAAIYLFGFIVLPHDTKPESIGVFRLVFALSFLSGALYLLPGVYGRPLANWVEAFIQTTAEEREASAGPGGGGHGDAAHIPWEKNDWDGALARAKEKDRPALFDFTGVG